MLEKAEKLCPLFVQELKLLHFKGQQALGRQGVTLFAFITFTATSTADILPCLPSGGKSKHPPQGKERVFNEKKLNDSLTKCTALSITSTNLCASNWFEVFSAWRLKYWKMVDELQVVAVCYSSWFHFDWCSTWSAITVHRLQTCIAWYCLI